MDGRLMDFPSETKMVAALVQAAMLDSLEKQVTITNVAGFKATVERRLYEGEAAHAGYIKLAYKAMARRRRDDPDEDLPNRPPSIDDVLDDEDHPVATPDQAARWQAVITRLRSLPADHPARALVQTRGHDSRRLRGIPAIGRGVAGVINGTQPGAGYCGDCGKRSGEHHHRTCRQNGVIV
jgi:hypothetical protein